jgi:regulator of RNase E activity RraA
VVIVPEDRVEEAIEKAQTREDKEAAVRVRLNAGETSLKIYDWDKKFGY